MAKKTRKNTTEKRPPGRPPSLQAEGRAPIRSLRIGDERWASYRAAADATGLTLSEWIRRTLDRAVE
jgi:hypothetical protein